MGIFLFALIETISYLNFFYIFIVFCFLIQFSLILSDSDVDSAEEESINKKILSGKLIVYY